MAHLRPRYTEKEGRKRLSSYHAEFYDPLRRPRRKYVALRTKNMEAARGKLALLEGRYGRGEWDPWTDTAPREDVILNSAVDAYLKAKPDLRPSSVRSFRSLAGLLAKRVGEGFPLSAVEPRHLALVIRRDLSERTRLTYHARLAAFFTWCVGQSMIDRSPLANAKKPRVGRRHAEFVSREQYAELLKAIEDDAVLKESGGVRQMSLRPGQIRWMADVIRVAVGTGFRIGELCALRWSGVNLKTGFVTVKTTASFRSKSGHERAVPVAGDALEVLQRLDAERAGRHDRYVFRPTTAGPGEDANLDERYVSRRFKKYAGLAGLPDTVHFHTLRHTYASWLVMEGVPLGVVKELLGHASVSTTEIYAHLAPARLQADVLRVFGASDPPPTFR